MNLHEYQGKEILNSFGVRIQRGIVASTPEEAVAAAKQLNEKQEHRGGLSKPKFTLVVEVKVVV